MTYQKLVIPVDHGNQNIKREHIVFTSGLVEDECKPVLGDYLYYKDRYYSLTDQRIPYIEYSCAVSVSLDRRFPACRIGGFTAREYSLLPIIISFTNQESAVKLTGADRQ